MIEQITLYTSKTCPFSQRVELALAEASAVHNVTKFFLDLKNKPDWYSQVNPALKVPTIAYGGPSTSPEQPSPDSVKLTESLLLIEFIAELYPDSDLLPKDPVQRAKIRFFIDTVGKTFASTTTDFLFGHGSLEHYIEVFDIVQSHLPPAQEGKFLFGNTFTLADISIVTFLGRHLDIYLKNGFGRYGKAVGKQAFEILQGPKYERLWQYNKEFSSRPSWKATIDEPYLMIALAEAFPMTP